MERNYEFKFIKQVEYKNTYDVGSGQDILMEGKRGDGEELRI